MNSHYRQIAQFIISGGLAFAAEFSSFIALLHLIGSGVIVANTISFAVGLLTSFTLNKVWVFSGEQDHSTKKQFVLYIVVAGINLLITNVTIYLLIKTKIQPELAKVLVIGMIAGWNYLIFKKLIFKKHH